MALLLGESPTKMCVMGRDGALETLGELLRLARKSSGTTLIEMARIAGVSKGHLSHVENGRDRPSRALVSTYEERFQTDGQLWSAYVEVCTSSQARIVEPMTSGTSYPLPGDASEFITDVTIPDGLIMPPGFRFRKTWRIKNSGSVPWLRRWLARDGSPSGHGIPQSPSRVLIANTAPGELVDITVPLRAHELAGTAQVRWKMVDDSGFEYFPDRYYQGLILTIVVREGASEPIVGPLGCGPDLHP